MKELLDDLDRWRSAGTRVALARVVDVEGSGPRGPGAAMAVSLEGEVAGDKSVVPQLKDLTAKKKALEADLERAVAGTHQGQELTELSSEQRKPSRL